MGAHGGGQTGLSATRSDLPRRCLVLPEIESMFRHMRHPHTEATVRLAEPHARLEWRGPATLRVELPWDRDGRDFPRLDRLVALLSVYRDELGLERIELGSTYRIAEPSAGDG